MQDVPAWERDPRMTRLETEVVEAGTESGRPWVVLADTILYPEGGGQPADHGTVGGVAVLDVQRAGGVVRHHLAGPAPSGRVVVELDWHRRFDHMQQHTAQHLLTAVADARWGWHTTAFHLGANVSDIELDVAALDADRMEELEEAVAAEIRAARAVRARRVSQDAYASMSVRSRGLPEGHTGDVRLVEIEGIDLNTCGGTHLASTAEIEALKLLGTEPVRGGTRLFWVAGRRLRGFLGAHEGRAVRIRELLGTSDAEAVDRLAGKLEQLRGAEKAVRALEDELAVALAAVLAAEAGPVLAAHWPERSLPFLQRVARETVRLAPDRAVFLTSGSAGEGAFVLAAGAASPVDVSAVGPVVAAALDGRGGGAGGLFQGKAGRLSAREEALRLLSEASATPRP